MRGFTLIEFIVYVAIIGVMSAIMTGFLWNMILGNVKETSYQEVQQNARFALAKITQETKKATGIISPVAGASSTSLSLSMAAGTTTFNVAEQKLRITQDASSSDLTSEQVIVSNLQFTNLSYPDTPGTIRIEMTIDHVNPDNRVEYEASIDLKSTISLAPGGAP